MYIHIGEIIELARVEAIAFKLRPTPASLWRNLCREYSKKFHTKLDEVLEMSPEFVISHVMEERFTDVNVDENLEELMEPIYMAEDPNYESNKEKDVQSWIGGIQAEENQRQKAGKPINMKKASYKNKAKQEVVPEVPKDLPKEGFVNFSYIN